MIRKIRLRDFAPTQAVEIDRLAGTGGLSNNGAGKTMLLPIEVGSAYAAAVLTAQAGLLISNISGEFVDARTAVLASMDPFEVFESFQID